MIVVLVPRRPVADSTMRPLAEAGVVFSSDCMRQARKEYFQASSDKPLIVTQVSDEDRLVKLIASINMNEDLNYLVFFDSRGDGELTVNDCLDEEINPKLI